MFMYSDNYNYSVMLGYYEGEGGGGEGGGAGGGASGGGTADEKKFTQEDVNKFISKERAIFQKKFENVVKEKTEALQRIEEGTKEHSFLTKQIEEYRALYETAEDKHKRTAKEREENYTKEVTTLSRDRDTWKNKYTESRIARELMDAAMTHGAISAEDIVLALRNMTDLVPINDDDGKHTGEFDVKVKMTIKEEDKTKTLILSPADAVKRMKENTARYGHYFKSGQSGGAGGSNNTTGGESDVQLRENMTVEQYMKWRKNNAAQMR